MRQPTTPLRDLRREIPGDSNAIAHRYLHIPPVEGESWRRATLRKHAEEVINRLGRVGEWGGWDEF